MQEVRARQPSTGARAGGMMTWDARSEHGQRSDATSLSEVGVEIDVADDYRLPRETSRALVHVMMAVRDRKLASERRAT